MPYFTITLFSVQSFDEIQIPQPDEAMLEEFTQNVRPMFEQVRLLADRNRVLREARDVLLPRLVSGEVSVEDIPLLGEVE